MSIYKVVKHGRARWCFEFDRRIGGRRVRVRRLLHPAWTRAQADAYDRKESAALYAIATGVAKPRRTIDEAVGRYLRERAPELKQGENLRREIHAVEDWWRGRPVEDLPVVCEEYATDQLGALAPATIKNRISYLRAACRWAWKRYGIGESDPGARVVAPAVRNARDITITRRQMVALARACRHPGVRALIRIAYYTGMRVSEIQRAKRGVLPQTGGVGDSCGGVGCLILQDSKNATPRIVPAVPIISTALRVPMPRRSEIDYYWPEARAACGLDHVRLHDLRHTAASEMVSAGIDLSTVGAVLGHKSHASTKRYSHYSVERLSEAVGKIGRKRG